MKIAVISDIHSNVYALEAVLNDIEKRKVDQVVNLGDIFYGPIAPGKTFDLLKSLSITTICGNQDRMIYEATGPDVDANRTLQLVLQELGDEGGDWTRALPKTVECIDEVFCCHGSPESDEVYWLEDVTAGTPRVKSEERIIELLGPVSNPVIVCGHTHIPRIVSLQNGIVIVNPGSVGLPAYEDDAPCYHAMENYTPHASYSVLERTEKGLWNVEQIKIQYDYQAAAELAAQRGRDDWAQYLKTGRAL